MEKRGEEGEGACMHRQADNPPDFHFGNMQKKLRVREVFEMGRSLLLSVWLFSLW